MVYVNSLLYKLINQWKVRAVTDLLDSPTDDIYQLKVTTNQTGGEVEYSRPHLFFLWPLIEGAPAVPSSDLSLFGKKQ